MRYLVLSVIAVLFVLFSCSDQSEELFDQTSDGLIMSTDTVRFDTLLSGRISYTQRVRIINKSHQKAFIPALGLRNGAQSSYSITLNGLKAKQHNNVAISPGDSLLLLVDVLPPTTDSFGILAYYDEINWINPFNGNIQSVILESWTFSAESKEKSIICNETWTKNTALIVTDSILVQSNCHLIIEEGISVFLDPGAVLFIQGQLEVRGTFENPVIFRASRMDGHYKQAPGYWNGIYFLEGSRNNLISNTVIENSQTGIRMGTPDNDTIPDLLLKNVIIRHNSQFAIQSYNSDLYAENLLVYDIGYIPCFHAIGGSYSYVHSTIANFPSQFGSQDPVMVFADHLLGNEETLQDQLLINLQNSIFWGGGATSDLYISLIDESTNRLNVSNNIIYGQQEWTGNIVNEALEFIHFKNPFGYNYQLDSLSPAINSGTFSSVLVDLSGQTRDSIPDIGAFEYFPNE